TLSSSTPRAMNPAVHAQPVNVIRSPPFSGDPQSSRSRHDVPSEAAPGSLATATTIAAFPESACPATAIAPMTESTTIGRPKRSERPVIGTSRLESTDSSTGSQPRPKEVERHPAALQPPLQFALYFGRPVCQTPHRGTEGMAVPGDRGVHSS